MDALRRRWHDIVAPKLRKARWFVALWVVLALVAVPWGVRAEERGLEAATAAALSDAGVTVEDIAFTGRDAVISATLTGSERIRAEAALGEVDGIRSIDWQIAPAVEPPPVTTPATTTTTVPPESIATLNIRVRLGRIILSGRLPDAHQIASLGSSAAMTYRADVINRLSVGDVVEADWLEGADRLVASLGLVSAAELAFDHAGITGTAVVPTIGAADAFDERLDVFRDAGVPVDVALDVSEGDAANLVIVADGDVVTAEGVLYRAAFIERLDELLAATGDRAVESTIRINKSLAPTFAVTRLDELVGLLVRAEQWELSYEDETVSGAWFGKGLLPRDPEKAPTATAVELIDEIAALMVGDPRLHLTIEVGSVVWKNGSTDIELARLRATALEVALIRRGVDPGRIEADGTDEGEVLRFLLEPAER